MIKRKASEFVAELVRAIGEVGDLPLAFYTMDEGIEKNYDLRVIHKWRGADDQNAFLVIHLKEQKREIRQAG